MEKFKIVCKKCGKDCDYDTEPGPCCDCCSGGGSITFNCECGEEETVYL